MGRRLEESNRKGWPEGNGIGISGVGVFCLKREKTRGGREKWLDGLMRTENKGKAIA